MPTTRERDKLLHRVRRIRGQLNAVEEALNADKETASIVHTMSACRGAMDGLMLELLEDHIRANIVDPERRPTSQQAQATQDLIDVLRSYLK